MCGTSASLPAVRPQGLTLPRFGRDKASVADLNSRYLVLLRRELVRALARLKRAERERDELAAENDRLKARLARVPGRRRRTSGLAM